MPKIRLRVSREIPYRCILPGDPQAWPVDGAYVYPYRPVSWAWAYLKITGFLGSSNFPVIKKKSRTRKVLHTARSQA